MRPLTVAFSGFQVHHIRKKKVEPEIMIDSGSTIKFGKVKVLFKEIHDLDEDVIMDTNGGQKNIDQEGEWTGYGQAYFVVNLHRRRT